MLYNLFENRDFVSVFAVALLAEGVDRNNPLRVRKPENFVALLAEGVDRNPEVQPNFFAEILSPSSRRAWIEMIPARPRWKISASPSSRRAWIEIHRPCTSFPSTSVALLAEGVDRNSEWMCALSLLLSSPSSRRAWIEIYMVALLSVTMSVALLAEGVDRNLKNGCAFVSMNVALLAEGVDRNA